ncbi:MAG: T9SS type A sorting domain-containing protein [Bacteroidales bacterium]|nr:T9SS type A sorting domain-containing protein [Bacteroidales bacterium]
MTISGIPDYTGDLRISILNVNGQTIRRKAIAAYHHTIRIDVRELPAGLYFLQVESKDWRCYHKIIIR